MLTIAGTTHPPIHTPHDMLAGGHGAGSLSHYCPAEGVRANGLSVQGESWQIHTAYSSAARPEPVTWTPPARPLPTPEMAWIKIPSLLAMQIVPGDNEVAREETVLGEIWSAVPSTVAEFLTCHFRKFLSKLPGIIFSRETLTLLFVFLLRLCAKRRVIPHPLTPSFPPISGFLSTLPHPSWVLFSTSILPHPALCSFLSFPLYSSVSSPDIAAQALEPSTLGVQIPSSWGLGSCL